MEQLHPLPRNKQQANGQVTSGLRTAPGLAQGLGSKIQGNKTLRPPHGRVRGVPAAQHPSDASVWEWRGPSPTLGTAH